MNWHGWPPQEWDGRRWVYVKGEAMAKNRKPFDADAPAMHPELWPLHKILPYPNNARTHPPAQVAMLAAILKKRGPDQPIVVDEAGVILKGHGRRLGALAADLAAFPVVVRRGLPEAEKAAMRIEDNQVALLAGWDMELIRGEITGLKLGGYDVGLLGFPEAQLRGWGISAGTDSEQDPEAVPERPKKPVVRKGDLWVLGDHRLLCGDCTNANDVATSLGGAEPHLMVTDPPYGVNYDPNWRNEPEKLNLKSTTAFAKKTIGRVVNDDRADWTEAWKFFPGDVAYVWCGERQSVSMAIQLQGCDFELRNLIVWTKTHHVISRGHYHPQHETCWYVVRKGKTAHWAGDRAQSTCWTIPNLRQFGRDDGNPETGHGTQKPIECMKRPIENNSRKGDHVYDPFVGSGTTIIACEMTGRKALAIEIDPGYCQVAIERWQTFVGKLATLDGRTLEQIAKARRRGLAKGATDAEARPPV